MPCAVAAVRVATEEPGGSVAAVRRSVDMEWLGNKHMFSVFSVFRQIIQLKKENMMSSSLLAMQ